MEECSTDHQRIISILLRKVKTRSQYLHNDFVEDLKQGELSWQVLKSANWNHLLQQPPVNVAPRANTNRKSQLLCLRSEELA